MQDHAAVFRTGPVLAEGVQKMREIAKEFGDMKITDQSRAWYFIFELFFSRILMFVLRMLMLLVSCLVVGFPRVY